MNNPANYAKALLKNNGKEQAQRIAAENVAICERSSNTVLFDEAEFYVSTERTLATYELANTQSKKVEGAKTNREKRNLNFWKQVNDILKK
jgi:hypothetical protein